MHTAPRGQQRSPPACLFTLLLSSTGASLLLAVVPFGFLRNRSLSVITCLRSSPAWWSPSIVCRLLGLIFLLSSPCLCVCVVSLAWFPLVSAWPVPLASSAACCVGCLWPCLRPQGLLSLCVLRAFCPLCACGRGCLVCLCAAFVLLAFLPNFARCCTQVALQHFLRPSALLASSAARTVPPKIKKMRFGL